MKLLKWILIIRGKKNKKERTSETKASTSDFINTCDLVRSGAEREACAERVMIAHLVCVLGVKRGITTLHIVKVLILQRDMSVQTGGFQYIKSSQNGE